MMDCAEFETRLNELLDDRQTPSDDQRLFQHARECLGCRQLLVQLQTMGEVIAFLGATRPVPHERHCSPCWRRGAAGEHSDCRRREESLRLSVEGGEARTAAAAEAVGEWVDVELSKAEYSQGGRLLVGSSPGSSAGAARGLGEQDAVSRARGLNGKVGLAGKIGLPLLVVCLLLSVVVGVEHAVSRWDSPFGVMTVGQSAAENATTGRSLALSAQRWAEMTSGDLGPRRAASVMEVVVYDPLFVWPKRAMRVAGQLPAAPTPAWDVRAWVEPTTWVEPVAEQLVSERLTELRSEPWQLVAGWASGMRPLATSMTAALEDWIDVWVPPLRDESQRRLPLESDQWDWRWDLTA